MINSIFISDKQQFLVYAPNIVYLHTKKIHYLSEFQI